MLLTDELLARFRQLGEQDSPNPIVPVRFHAPWQNCSWYPFSYDEAKKCFYGLIQCVEIRLDYFSHIDLMVERSPNGEPIERDPNWRETDLNRLRLYLDFDI